MFASFVDLVFDLCSRLIIERAWPSDRKYWCPSDGERRHLVHLKNPNGMPRAFEVLRL